MVEVTVEITQFCEGGCPWCSSNATPEGEHLDYESIEAFLKNRQNIERINISGGEPLAHPDFYKILKLCHELTEDVWVYTNALRQIKYNTHILREIKVEANTVLISGELNYVSKNVRTNLLKFIPQGRGRTILAPCILVSRNFHDPDACDSCNHILLQADGRIMKAPCVKRYSL